MHELLETLQRAFPQFHYQVGKRFCWSPATRTIVYRPSETLPALWSLLHETSHALLNHDRYCNDVELLKLEVHTWDKAKELAAEFHLVIDDSHIEDCLDSYRDWLNARSTCSSCGTKSLQKENVQQYRCFNCRNEWRVTPSRLCRVYRLHTAARLRSLAV